MLIKRRKFIKNSAYAGLFLGLSSISNIAFSKNKKVHLTILHTNDFEGNWAGFENLKNTIISEREQNKNVLLFDSGDFTGIRSPNKGELEFKLLNQLKYDAITLGNKEFLHGKHQLSHKLSSGSAPIIVTNYTFAYQKLQQKIGAYHILYKDGIKIGVFGLGIDLNDYYSKSDLKGYSFQNPIEIATITSKFLKQTQQCDFIICLSHLGYEYPNNKIISDVQVASKTTGIDLILGGHSHINLKKGATVNNKNGQKTFINQAGSLGKALGKIDLVFEHQKVKSINCRNIEIKRLTLNSTP